MMKFGALLCMGTIICAAPAFAGFEFTPQKMEESAQASQNMDEAMMGLDSPMPIVPVEAVSAAPLNAPSHDRVLAAPVSNAVDPVYIRRQRASIPPSGMKSKPMETEELLTATANNQPIFPERLVINPYPLEGAATHGDNMGRVGMEQAMLEETGMLRPVETPGSNRAGMVSRVRKSTKTATQRPQIQEPQSNMTPLPVDSGYVDRMPVSDKNMPEPAPLLSHSSQQSSQNGFSEAVGFGRDLPLALALSQVVPPEYSYSFSQNVNVGTTVSWQGGKPWNQVLDDMLAPNGMRADIQDGQVLIKNARG